jgi:hypothetical protein
MAEKNAVKPVVVNTDGLYERHKTIYAKSVRGIFDNWRWAMVFLTQALFYGLCWIDWGGRQAVLFHLGRAEVLRLRHGFLAAGRDLSRHICW